MNAVFTCPSPSYLDGLWGTQEAYLGPFHLLGGKEAQAAEAEARAVRQRADVYAGEDVERALRQEKGGVWHFGAMRTQSSHLQTSLTAPHLYPRSAPCGSLHLDEVVMIGRSLVQIPRVFLNKHTCVHVYLFYGIFLWRRPVPSTEVQRMIKMSACCCCPTPDIKDTSVASTPNFTDPMILSVH